MEISGVSYIVPPSNRVKDVYRADQYWPNREARSRFLSLVDVATRNEDLPVRREAQKLLRRFQMT